MDICIPNEFMCIYVCHVYIGEVTLSCELPDIDAGTWSCVLDKNS